MPITKRVPVPEHLKKSLGLKIEQDIKNKLGVTSVGAETKAVIDEVVQEVAGTIIAQNVERAAVAASKEAIRGRVDHASAVATRLKGALRGVRIVSESDELSNLLRENAKMLFMKMKALRDAGFTEDQAFQLILAEVTAKKSR